MKRLILLLLIIAMTSPFPEEFFQGPGVVIEAATKKKTSAKNKASSSRKGATSKKSSANKKKGKSLKSKKGKSVKKIARPAYSVVYSDTATGEWIHRGRQKIVIHRDSAGVVRAMAPSGGAPSMGRSYAMAINQYADSLKSRGIKVYSMIVPSQGEFYMPSMISDNQSQEKVIYDVARLYFNQDVGPIFVSDTLRTHKEEEIYNRTDHHWSPLGAYYASAKLAADLGMPFPGLGEYAVDSVRNYVGTMYKFSGDPAVKNSPETFVYYIPPGDYYAEFIDYDVVNQITRGESEKHEAPIIRKFPDGSGAAYSTFLGGDNHTVRIVNRNGSTGRKLLIVKDSFGNAMAPCLINSFDEVHVIDFRYYPHNLIDYAEDNGITDLVFVNVTGIAFAPTTSARFQRMMKRYGINEQEEITDDDEDSAAEDDEEDGEAEEDIDEEEDEDDEDEQ